MNKTNPDITKSKRNINYPFNNDELRQLGHKLAELGEGLGALKADKKRVVKDFDAKITAIEAEQGIVINQLRSGYDYRDVPVIVHLDQPKPGQKTIYRDEDGEEGEKICVEAMSLDEQQRELPMEETHPNN